MHSQLALTEHGSLLSSINFARPCISSIITILTPDGQISFSGRIQILEDGGVLIAKVRTTDRGKYTCTRANEAGSVTGDAWLEVMVRTQIILPPVDTKVILGHVASMSCKVSADHNVPFEVSWYHDGRLINDDASYRYVSAAP